MALAFSANSNSATSTPKSELSSRCQIVTHAFGFEPSSARLVENPKPTSAHHLANLSRPTNPPPSTLRLLVEMLEAKQLTPPIAPIPNVPLSDLLPLAEMSEEEQPTPQPAPNPTMLLSASFPSAEMPEEQQPTPPTAPYPPMSPSVYTSLTKMPEKKQPDSKTERPTQKKILPPSLPLGLFLRSSSTVLLTRPTQPCAARKRRRRINDTRKNCRQRYPAFLPALAAKTKQT